MNDTCPWWLGGATAALVAAVGAQSQWDHSGSKWGAPKDAAGTVGSGEVEQ